MRIKNNNTRPQYFCGGVTLPSDSSGTGALSRRQGFFTTRAGEGYTFLDRVPITKGSNFNPVSFTAIPTAKIAGLS